MNTFASFLMLACLAPVPPEPAADQRAAGFFGMHMTTDGDSIRVTEVVEDFAAQRGGLKADDVLKKLGDWEIDGIDGLRETIASMRPGTKIPVTVLRKGAKVTLTIRVMAKP